MAHLLHRFCKEFLGIVGSFETNKLNMTLISDTIRYDSYDHV